MMEVDIIVRIVIIIIPVCLAVTLFTVFIRNLPLESVLEYPISMRVVTCSQQTWSRIWWVLSCHMVLYLVGLTHIRLQ